MTNLYDDDFYRWLQQQVQLLRERRFDDLDLESLIDEIESLARARLRHLRAAVRSILMYTLLLRAAPNAKERWEWETELTHFRIQVEDEVDLSPSLKKKIAPILSMQWDRAVKLAAVHLQTRGYPGADSLHSHPISLKDLFGEFADEL